MDFAFLPPEVNSARMYSGPGSSSLRTAAGSWDSLAAELSTTAETYDSVLSSLTSLHWRGPVHRLADNHRPADKGDGHAGQGGGGRL